MSNPLFQFIVRLQPLSMTRQPQSLRGEQTTARGLHGLFYSVLKQADPESATWLHTHSAPKPYTLAPFYTEEGELVALRISAFSTAACELIYASWQMVSQLGVPLRLGNQGLYVETITVIHQTSFPDLANSSQEQVMKLRFLSPTAFKQGPGSLPLPLPINVFGTPARIWQAYAPSVMPLPERWLDWCQQNVFVTEHQIATATVPLNQHSFFLGFVGEVIFTARSRQPSYLCAWQTLGKVAAFCGVGHKTTMGMGAVEKVETSTS